jgi:hypothetical protein
LWFREGRGLTRPEYARLVTELIISGTPEAVVAAGEARQKDAAGLRK